MFQSINIKQEPIDVEEDEDDMMEILDDSDDRGHCDELRDVSVRILSQNTNLNINKILLTKMLNINLLQNIVWYSIGMWL